MNKMTFEQWAVKELFSCGLSESDAQAIVELAKSDDVLQSMSDRWNDDINGYPSSMLSVFLLSIKRVALAWTNENKPLAWYKPMFE